MNIPIKQLKSGFSLPVYGLGTFMMGGRMEPDTANDHAELKAIRAAIEHGITHIDTAEVYGGGHTEELVGEAIKDQKRSDLLITSKVGSGSMTAGYDGVMRAVEGSLRRLGTDYIDLYLLHQFPGVGSSVAEVMRAMNELKEQGVIKQIGVSNFTVNRLKEVQKHTSHQIICNQVEYSVQSREVVARGIVEYCQQDDMFVMAWGPLQKGILEQGDMLQKLANKYNKTPYQVALNWLLAQTNVIAIPKTTSDAHLEENLGALGWQMEAEDAGLLTKDFPNQQQISERVPLDYAGAVAP